MLDKKKVAILTIHNVDNYGAILQTFSVFNYIKFNFDPIIINYKNPMFEPSLKLIRYGGLSSFKSCIKDIIRLKSRFIFIKKFKEFIKQNLKLTNQVSREELNSSNFLNNFDILLVGSDQVWNPNITNLSKKLNSDYFFNSHISKKIKKVSYASSFGGKIFTSDELEKVNFYLESFDKISVREKNTLRYLNYLNKQKADYVLDPVFLTDKIIWQQMAKLSDNYSDLENTKYILVYSVVRSKLIKKITDKLKKITNFKIITIDPNLVSNTTYYKKISNAGPLDFLKLFDNASVVVTDSFHGTSFSLILDKIFFSAVSEKVYANRISDLLKNIRSEKNIITDVPMIDKLDEIKYFSVSRESKIELNKLIIKSKKFLNESLNLD